MSTYLPPGLDSFSDALPGLLSTTSRLVPSNPPRRLQPPYLPCKVSVWVVVTYWLTFTLRSSPSTVPTEVKDSSVVPLTVLYSVSSLRHLLGQRHSCHPTYSLPMCTTQIPWGPSLLIVRRPLHVHVEASPTRSPCLYPSQLF